MHSTGGSVAGYNSGYVKAKTWGRAQAAFRHLIVDDAGDAFDVEASRCHVRCDQDAVWTALEPVQRLRNSTCGR